MDAVLQDVGRRNKVCIQNEEKFSLRLIEPVIQGASLESYSVFPVQDDRVEPTLPELGNCALGQLASLIRGVIQNLDIEFVLRIV